jgi:hypothetical protein
LRTFWPNNKIAIPCPTNNTLYRVTLSYLISWWNRHLPTLHESHMCPVPINRCSNACKSRVLFYFQSTNICFTAWIPSSLKSRQHFHLSSLAYALSLSHHPFLYWYRSLSQFLSAFTSLFFMFFIRSSKDIQLLNLSLIACIF